MLRGINGILQTLEVFVLTVFMVSILVEMVKVMYPRRSRTEWSMYPLLGETVWNGIPLLMVVRGRMRRFVGRRGFGESVWDWCGS